MLKNTAPPIAIVLVKAVSKDGPKDSEKMFTLHDLDTTSILSCKDLKQAIRRQLSDNIIFDVGYLEGSRIRNGRDLEVWSCIRQLWCDGLSKIKESRKRLQTDEIPEGSAKKKLPDIGNKRFSNWLIV